MYIVVVVIVIVVFPLNNSIPIMGYSSLSTYLFSFLG